MFLGNCKWNATQVLFNEIEQQNSTFLVLVILITLTLVIIINQYGQSNVFGSET